MRVFRYQSVFQRSMPPDLIRGWTRFASRKRVKTENLEPRFDSIETEKALGQAGLDEFGFKIVLDAEAATLAAHAAFLDAAERRFGRGDRHLVDADHADLQRFRRQGRGTQIAREHVAGQAER